MSRRLPSLMLMRRKRSLMAEMRQRQRLRIKERPSRKLCKWLYEEIYAGNALPNVHGHGAWRCMVSCVYVAVREAVSGFWILDLLLAMHDVTRPPRTSRLFTHTRQTKDFCVHVELI